MTDYLRGTPPFLMRFFSFPSFPLRTALPKSYYSSVLLTLAPATPVSVPSRCFKKQCVGFVILKIKLSYIRYPKIILSSLLKVFSNSNSM